MTIETLSQKWASGAAMSAPLLAVTFTRRFSAQTRVLATVPLILTLGGYAYFNSRIVRALPF